MLTFDKIAKEIVDKYARFFPKYGNQIPSSVLSFSASEYFKTISKIRSSGDTHKDFKRILTINLLYGDFVGPTGANENDEDFKPPFSTT